MNILNKTSIYVNIQISKLRSLTSPVWSSMKSLGANASGAGTSAAWPLDVTVILCSRNCVGLTFTVSCPTATNNHLRRRTQGQKQLRCSQGAWRIGMTGGIGGMSVCGWPDDYRISYWMSEWVSFSVRCAFPMVRAAVHVQFLVWFFWPYMK